MLRERVEQVIEEKIRPALARDGGNIELVHVTEDGEVHVRRKALAPAAPEQE